MAKKKINRNTILSRLTTSQSEALTERIISSMERMQHFTKKAMFEACAPTAVDAVSYPQEAVAPAVDAVIRTFVGAGMLVREGKYYTISKFGQKVNN